MSFFFRATRVEKLKRTSSRDKIFHFMFITITGEMKRIEYFSSFIKSRHYSHYTSSERMNE